MKHQEVRFVHSWIPVASSGRGAEDTKRWQEYTELSKKDLHDPGNHDGVITHLEPGILEGKSSEP